MGCSKPDCDCLEKEEQRIGGPVKYGYPCLHDKSTADEFKKLKSPPSPLDRSGSQPGKEYKRRFLEKWIPKTGFDSRGRSIPNLEDAERELIEAIKLDQPSQPGEGKEDAYQAIEDAHFKEVHDRDWEEMYWILNAEFEDYKVKQPPLTEQGKEEESPEKVLLRFDLNPAAHLYDKIVSAMRFYAAQFKSHPEDDSWNIPENLVDETIDKLVIERDELKAELAALKSSNGWNDEDMWRASEFGAINESKSGYAKQLFQDWLTEYKQTKQ